MTNIKHSGFDLFFTGLTMKRAKLVVAALNSLGSTMHGQRLKFKINKQHSRPLKHQQNSIVITTFYKPVTVDASDLYTGLAKNRELIEPLAETLGCTYEGSEFYINVDSEKHGREVSRILAEVALT